MKLKVIFLILIMSGTVFISGLQKISDSEPADKIKDYFTNYLDPEMKKSDYDKNAEMKKYLS